MNNCIDDTELLKKSIKITITGQLLDANNITTNATPADFTNCIDAIVAIKPDISFTDEDTLNRNINNSSCKTLKKLLAKVLVQSCPDIIKIIDKQFIININNLSIETSFYDDVRSTLYNYLNQENPTNEPQIKNIIENNTDIINNTITFIQDNDKTIRIEKYKELFQTNYIDILTLMGFLDTNTDTNIFINIKRTKK